MRILFVLHAPKEIDGVGDYTAILAKKLTEMGHCTAILGLSTHVLPAHGTRHQTRQGIPLTLVPWSPWSHCAQREARMLAKRFSPDWVSLQFVNYAWNYKGVVFNVIPAFKRLFAGFRLHAYFHEIWVGYFQQSSPKKKLMGFIQRLSIKLLARATKPRIVHTNSSFQEDELSKAGISALRNPLFGNIPCVPSPDFTWIYQLLQNWNKEASRANRSLFTFIGLFGNLSEALIQPAFYESLEKYSRENMTRPIFLFIGNLRADGRKVLDECQKRFSTFPFLNFGPRSPKEISEFLQFVDFACATSANHQVEKSGTFAALVEHAVPTLVFETFEGKGIRTNLPPNARLFQTGDLLPQLPARKTLIQTPLLDQHARVFFDSLLFPRV